MAEKVIAAVGISDEEIARLRLLMRKASDQLMQSWRWGSETHADLLVIDVNGFAGQMARSRAKVSGLRVALVVEPGGGTEGEPAMYRPFKLENVIDVLNQVSDAGKVSAHKPAPVEDYFEASLRRAGLLADEDGLVFDETGAQRLVDEDVAPGLDDLIRGHPLADPYTNLNPSMLDDSTRLEPTGEHTRRSEARSDRERELQGVSPAQQGAARSALPPEKIDTDLAAGHRLRDYLKGHLIAGPVQIAWAGAGVLTLDPKNASFHSPDPLAKLEGYCRQPMKRADWRRLTSAELAGIRQSQPAQPFERLVWLDTLVNAQQKLASHLDPGGSFQLSRWLELERDHPRFARIGDAMRRPARLHEIAAASGSEMGDVFALVTAYDAIGCLKWSPRPPRHAEPEDDGKMASLMKKLRKPFRKS